MLSTDSKGTLRDHISSKRRRFVGRTRAQRAAILTAAVLAMFGTYIMGDNTEQQDTLLDSIEQISMAKSTAENRVRLLRALANDGELTKVQLRQIQFHYSEARARVNASFDRILVELETTSDESFDSFEKLAKQASEEVNVFVEAADDVILGEDRSGTVAAAAIGAAAALFESLVVIWKRLRGESQAQRTALITRLEALKWDAFDAVQ
jgi:hypothetical protein